jgi:hypothetical protein
MKILCLSFFVTLTFWFLIFFPIIPGGYPLGIIQSPTRYHGKKQHWTFKNEMPTWINLFVLKKFGKTLHCKALSRYTREIRKSIYNSVARLLHVENVSSMLFNDMVFFCCYRNMDCGQSIFWQKLQYFENVIGISLDIPIEIEL